MILQVENMEHGYKKHPVFRNVSFSMEGEGFGCIIGPNGVGKSTLLKCLNGIFTPHKGQVLLDGKNVHHMTLKQRASLFGYVPQFTTVNPCLNVLETVVSGRMPHMQSKASKEDISFAEQILEELHLTEFALRELHQLSGGERQRILVARALAQEPVVMLLDEPTSNLDLHYQLETMELMRNMAKEKGIMVLAVVHDLNAVLRYADRVFLLSAEGIKAEGSPQEVINHRNMLESFEISSAYSEIAGYKVMVPLKSMNAGE